MSTEPVLTKARALWEGLAAVPVSFSSPIGVSVVVSPKALPRYTIGRDAALVSPPGPVAVRPLDHILAANLRRHCPEVNRPRSVARPEEVAR
ncbi:hypothetical protein ABZ942_17795 [Nocardia sp. NPDC046473]|uniref:hypothetical protein n=1 Tax=Nocardia sp. NPDC046473 TaxID=3155733 RepID=UPI003407CC92